MNPKIKFITTAKASELKHPYYWSGFILNGNPDALVHKVNDTFYFIISIVLVAFLILFLKFRK